MLKKVLQVVEEFQHSSLRFVQKKKRFFKCLRVSCKGFVL